MSLILEALKKSERQRRLGESPSLGSPIVAVRRRRSLLPALAVLILLGLVALWWIKREPAAPVAEPVAGTQAPEVATAPAKPAVADATTFNDNPQAPPRPPVSTTREVAQSSAATRQPRSKVPPDETSGLAPDLRQKVKSGEVVVPNTQLLKPGQPATIDEPSAAAAAGADDAAREQRATAAAMAEAAAAASGNPVQTNATSADSSAAPATPAAPAASPAVAPAARTPAVAPDPAMKLIWELPFATRREIPEIKLSMHVYADVPAQRFVIINGDRQVEGDEVGSLNLVEIRRDGVIFDYEGVRFLYPRGGR